MCRYHYALCLFPYENLGAVSRLKMFSNLISAFSALQVCWAQWLLAFSASIFC